MIVDRIQREHGLTALAHLTCVNHTREQVGDLLQKIEATGCRDILALRGDPPAGGEFQPTPGGFEFSAQLVKFIREDDTFDIGVAVFPEGHLACKEGKLADWQHLREKVEAGGFRAYAIVFRQLGLLCVSRSHQRQTRREGAARARRHSHRQRDADQKFTQLCGAKIPPAPAARLDEIGADDAAAAELGIEYATRQCEELLHAGAPGLHFHTLNKATSTLRVMKNLGLG